MNTVGGCFFALGGCVFAGAGLACLLGAVSQFGEMALPLSSHYVPSSSFDDGGWSCSGGFSSGAEAFFGMLFVAVGVGVGVAPHAARLSPATRHVIASALALLWHGVGIGALWYYRRVALQPDQWPFALFTLYEWVGLTPLGLGLSPDLAGGRLRGAVWNLMGGAFLGGVAGFLIGGLAGSVALFATSRHGSGFGADWWVLGFCGGAAVVGLAFAVFRLAGWELPTGDGRSPAPRPARLPACRNCGQSVQPDLIKCPVCHTHRRVRRPSAMGNVLQGVGLFCVVGSFAVQYVPFWLGASELRPGIAQYLFWLLMVGGWILIALGGLLGGGSRRTEARPTHGRLATAVDAVARPQAASSRSKSAFVVVWLIALALLGAVGFGVYTVRPCWRYQGKPTEHWLRQLKSPEAPVRAGAVKVLGGYARRPTRTTTWDPQTLGPLTAALDDPDIRVRHATAQSLQSLVSRQPGLTQPEKDRIAAALLAHLRAQPEDDIAAEYALASVGASVVPALVESLSGGNPAALRRKAAWALLHLAAEPQTVRSALPALRKATRDADPKVREYAVEALKKVEVPAEAPPPEVAEQP